MSNTFINIIGFIISAIFLIIAVKRIVFFLHMMQLQGYKNKRLINWFMKNPSKLFVISTIKEPKKRLVFTARATRLFIINLIFIFIVLAGTIQYGVFTTGHVALLSIAMLIILVFAPILMLLSNMIALPLEMMVNAFYFRSAQKKLSESKPKVIAITGSYGKTSTKDYLSSILSMRYKVLKTPGSFNTPMGICKIIRGELKPDHDVFIVELGARERGNIKELCNLVKPDMGVITSIGIQHLETFKHINNIMETKYELIDSLPVDGIAIFNNDDDNCRKLADKTNNKKVLRYGIQENNNKLFIKASDISITNRGIDFKTQNSKGSPVSFNSRLLGRHNVYNILAATAVALELGMSLKEISGAVKSLKAVPHRLNLIQGAGGVMIIDDAFNANPVGAKMALEVLSEIKGNRKILVTPGLVELGEKEYEENKRFGIEAANACDIVFLVGLERTKPIFEGLKESGFNEKGIYVEKSLKDVTDKFKVILKTGDVILFENDLPDNYNE